MREGVMNRWIILHQETYIQGKENQKDKRNNNAKFNQQKNFRVENNEISEQITIFAVVHFCLTTYTSLIIPGIIDILELKQ